MRTSWCLATGRAALVDTPVTFLSGPRAVVRRRWTHPHRRPGRPALPQATFDLIVRLTPETRTGPTCRSSAN